jgi:hypothetical protein
MKKLLLLFPVILITSFIKAQKGNNQIGVAFEVGVPMGDFGDAAKTGFGGLLKGLYGVGTAGQITFTTGYTHFGMKDLTSDESGNWWIMPFLAGYRHNFSGFYVEPQVGYGILGAKYEYLGASASDSQGAFAWGAGLGYAKNGFDGGIRYQGLSKDGTVSMIGFHVGYNFTLGGKQ